MENKYWRQTQENLTTYYQTVLKEIRKELATYCDEVCKKMISDCDEDCVCKSIFKLIEATKGV